MPVTLTQVLCLIGVVLLCLGMAGLGKQLWLKRACSVRAKARVSLHPCKPGSKEWKTILLPRGTTEAYYEVLTYPVLGVDRVVPTGHLSANNFRYSTAKNLVTVAFDPSKPSRYIILEKEVSLVPSLVCLVTGAVLAALELIPQTFFTDPSMEYLWIFLFGFVFATIGSALWWSDNKKKRLCTARVTGVVKGFETSHTSGKKGSRTSYHPIYAYTVEGVDYVQRSSVGSKRASFSEGQEIPILYDPAKPERYYVPGKEVGGFAFVFIGIGVLVLLYPFLPLVMK